MWNPRIDTAWGDRDGVKLQQCLQIPHQLRRAPPGCLEYNEFTVKVLFRIIIRQLMHHILKTQFAILLAALLVVGQALPLVWCTSGTEHAAVEFRNAGGAHHLSLAFDDSTPTASIAISTQKVLQAEPCVDRKLIPSAVTRVQSIQYFVIANIDGPSEWAHQTQSLTDILIRGNNLSVPPPFAHIPASISDLRTVILLI